jgi:hypothetical protein
MTLEIKIFDLSKDKNFLEKLNEMTFFHGAKINGKKTSFISTTENSRKNYNQKPYQNIKKIILKNKTFDIQQIREILKNHEEPVLINYVGEKLALFHSSNYKKHFYTGEKAKNQDNPFIRKVYGNEESAKLKKD